MKDEEKGKQTWQKPEIIDLDIDNTRKEAYTAETEGDLFGPS